MIAHIRGRLLNAWGKCCIVLTEGGVGYELTLTSGAFSALPSTGENVALYASLVVREDAQELFGFQSLEEKQAFEVLTGISRVGARTAIAMLSLHSPADLREIVLRGDVGALAKVPGIGKKTAQHIFLELKDRIATIGQSLSEKSLPGKALPSIFSDVTAALANLGYDEEESGPFIRKILSEEPDLDVSGAIRQILKAIARSRTDG